MGQIATLSLSDLNTTIDNEPRVHDLRLAEVLKFKRSRDIRKIIERNLVELETYGSLAPQRRKSRGQEFTEYFPNEAQAILITIRSDALEAPVVRRQLIEVNIAYRRGQLEKPISVRSHNRRTSASIDTALRLKTSADRLERAADRLTGDGVTRRAANVKAPWRDSGYYAPHIPFDAPVTFGDLLSILEEAHRTPGHSYDSRLMETLHRRMGNQWA